MAIREEKSNTDERHVRIMRCRHDAGLVQLYAEKELAGEITRQRYLDLKHKEIDFQKYINIAV